MKKLSIIFIILTSYFQSFTQSIDHQATSVAGEKFSQPSAQLSWTLGELTVGNYSNSSGSLTQGFPNNLIITVTDIQNTAEVELEINTYPNPSSDFLFIDIIGETNSEFALALSSINGQIITSQNNLREQTKLELSNLASGNYFLTVYNQDRTYTKTFKIAHIKK